MLDFWPERFFMLKGKNARGYTAELVDFPDLLSPGQATKKLVSISREEFLKVLVGSITLDTPDFINYYFTINPAGSTDAATLLSFGVALLHWSDDRFVERSTALLQKSNELFRAARDTKQERYSANRLHLALLIQYYHQVITRNPSAAEATMAELGQIWQHYGKEQIIESNRAIDFYRLGLNADNASDLDSAVLFFSRAIAKQPDYQEAYLYRGDANSKKRNYPAVISDTSEVLRLNTLARKVLAKEKARRHTRDKIGQARDFGTEYYLNQWQALALQLRGNSYRILGSVEKALQDGQELIRLKPKNSIGYTIVGLVQRDTGNATDALRNLQKAKELETDPRKLKLLEDTLTTIKN